MAPKGRNSFWQIVQQAKNDPVNWFHAILPASETGILLAAELEAAMRDMTPEQYAQEFECSFDGAIVGSYYGREIAQAEREGRVRESRYQFRKAGAPFVEARADLAFVGKTQPKDSR